MGIAFVADPLESLDASTGPGRSPVDGAGRGVLRLDRHDPNLASLTQPSKEIGMTTAIVCTVILAALVFLLGFNVSRMRGSQAPTDPASPLIAQRAHGNATEYVPTLMLMCCWWGPVVRLRWLVR